MYERWKILQRRKYTPEEVYLRYCSRHNMNPNLAYMGGPMIPYPTPKFIVVDGRLVVDHNSSYKPMTWEEIDAKRKNRRR